jgi:hypothetical protein
LGVDLQRQAELIDECSHRRVAGYPSATKKVTNDEMVSAEADMCEQAAPDECDHCASNL